MFEGDSADMCAGKFPLVSMEGLACADPGARTPIGASGIPLLIRNIAGWRPSKDPAQHLKSQEYLHRIKEWKDGANGVFTNNISDKRMHASEVKPVGKDEQKRIIQNAPSDSPAKRQKFQTLLEFWGGGGSSRMMCLAILKTWK